MWKWSAVQVVGRLGLFGGMAMFTFKSCQYCCEPLTTKECPGVEKTFIFSSVKCLLELMWVQFMS